MELKVLSEREEGSGGGGRNNNNNTKLGKGSEAEKGETCLKRGNKVRGWEEHGG